MPLKAGSSMEVIRENALMLIKEGRPKDQSWAIAYSNAGRSREKKK